LPRLRSSISATAASGRREEADVHLTELTRLQQYGGPVLAEYVRLVRAADASLHLSPAHLALAGFQQAWQQDRQAVTAAAAAAAEI
jgi:hypothetical protein